jgi:hypothetical protein
MLCRLLIGAVAVAATLSATVAVARAFDESRYPDWEGQWARMGDGRWDPSKPRALGQEAPLTPEYQKIYEDNGRPEAGRSGYRSDLCLHSRRHATGK